MDFSTAWWMSGSSTENPDGPSPGPGPSPGGEIKNSLRFRGAQYLQRDLGWGDTTTFSAWVKRGRLTDEQYLMGSAANSVYNQVYFLADSAINGANQGGSSQSTGLYRDPNAWYHIVYVRQPTGNTVRLYVNGEEVTYSITSTGTGSNSGVSIPFAVGGYPGGVAPFEGYMADVYFIDGQALEPTAFGRYNANGVWVPVDYSGTYGSNGFHLDFADPSNIGKDISGNGNDFTANGFNTSLPGVWSAGLSAEGGFLANMEPAKAFNGNLSDAAGGATNGGTMTFAPSAPITVTSSVSWYSTASVARPTTISWNGTTVTRTSTSWTTINGSGTLSASNPIVFAGDGNSLTTVPTCYAIAIDGTATENILVDNTGTDYDLMQDSPTQNYATINPLYPGASTSKANLTTANATGKPTILGIAGNVGVDGASVAWDGTEAGWTSTGAINFGQQPGGFDEISTRTMEAAPILDGREHFQAITGGLATYYVESGRSNSDDPVDLSTEVPFGQASAGAGLGSNNSGVVDLGGSNTTADVTWVYGMTSNVLLSLDGQTWRNLGVQSIPSDGATVTYSDGSPFRYVRLWRTSGDLFQNGILGPAGNNILALAQQTFPNGLWWIKDRANSNQHQLVDSVRGGNLALNCPGKNEAAYVAPSGDSVAWCWNAGGAAVANNDGSIASQVSANNQAGFSIVDYVGNVSAAQTVGHGLDEAPEFIIYKSADTTDRFVVYHSLISPAKALNLDGSGQAFDVTATIFNGAPDSTVLNIGGAAVVNSAASMIAYCWHSVPGYSAFGSYTGNGNVDGPFVYTGHSVSFILVKSSGSGDWYILDNTRSPFNPAENDLSPNQTIEEKTGSRVFDFLSNGFKVRQAYDSINKSGQEYIYAAFAENPFQSPATAR